MLEDEDYEVTYDPPELQAQGLVEAELSPTDIQLKGGEGLRIRPGSFCDCSYPPCVRETPPDAWRLAPGASEERISNGERDLWP